MVSLIEWLNAAGRAFVAFFLPMLIQSTVLILLLLAVDLLLRRRIRAVFRYALWMLVLLKLLLPPTLCAPTGLAYWLSGQFPALAQSTTGGMAKAQRGHVTPPPASQAPGFMPDVDSLNLKPHPSNLSSQPSTPSPSLSPPPGSPRLHAGGSFSPLTWHAALLLAWLAGMTLLTLLLLQRLLFVRGLIAQSQPAPGRLTDSLDACRRQMRLRTPIAIRLSPNAATPSVCGLLRPTILMPHTLPDRLTPAHLRAVILHELAHIKRGDLWLSLLQTALQIFYFYNPLLWLANALIRRVREQAVDEMVLVALGAAAPDYPDTLLRVSKLSLARPALSLRLIGVVESKHTLKARIRHMVSHPFPKSARLGLLSLIVLLLTAAALLPMAAAKNESTAAENKSEQTAENADHRYIATLSKGVTVELVSVCEHPSEGKQWWRPDGTPFKADFTVSSQDETNLLGEIPNYVLVIRNSIPEDSQFRLLDNQGSIWGGYGVFDAQGNSQSDMRDLRLHIKRPQNAMSIKYSVNSGDWKTLATLEGELARNGGSSSYDISLSELGRFNNRGKILFSKPLEVDNHIVIVITHKIKNINYRIVAIDTDGKKQIAEIIRRNIMDDLGQIMVRFSDLKLDQIKEIQFQAQPYEWVTFKNVSLKPNSKTDVQIEVDKSPAQPADTGNDATKNNSAIDKPDQDALLTEGNYGLLEVTVVTAYDKIPVADARINIHRSSGNQWFRGRTNSAGLARIRLLSGKYNEFQAHKEGLSQIISKSPVLIEAGQTAHIELSMRNLEKTSGIVLDPSGNPVAGAKINSFFSQKESQSDSQGRFEITWDPEQWSSSQPTGYLAVRDEARNLAAGLEFARDQKEIQVRLVPGLLITGGVTDSQGQPIVEARIRVKLHTPTRGSPMDLGDWWPGLAASASDGTFIVKAIPAGHKYKLDVTAPGYGRAVKDLQAQDAVDNRLDAGKLAMAVANLSVNGLVVDQNGNPVAGADVSAIGRTQPDLIVIKTDRNGRFAFNNVCPGPIEIDARIDADNLVGQTQTEGGADNVKIVLLPKSPDLLIDSDSDAVKNKPVVGIETEGKELPAAGQEPAGTSGESRRTAGADRSGDTWREVLSLVF